MAEKTKAASKNIGSQQVGSIQAVPLWLINATYNTRTVFPRLVEQGYDYITLIKMGISPDPKQRAEYVRLVEEFESEEVLGRTTVIQTARSIRKLGQLQAVRIQQLGTSAFKDDQGKVIGKKYGYALVAGNHRVAALAYNWAKYGHLMDSPVTAKQKDPFVRAELIRASKREAFDISLHENLLRNPLDYYQIGQHVAFYKEEEGMTWDEIGEHMSMSVPNLRECYSIFRPVDGVDQAAVLDKLSTKEITKAEAVAISTGKAPAPSRVPKALRIGDGATNSRTGPVNKVISYGEVVRKIDETPHDGKPGSVMRIRTLAEVIGLSYEDAMKASEDRLKKGQGKTG